MIQLFGTFRRIFVPYAFEFVTSLFISAKKGKKKGQTLNLTEFLGGDGGAYRAPGSGATTTVAVSSNWAEEMDEAEMEDVRGPRQQVS